MSLEMKKGVDLNNTTVAELETVTEKNTSVAIPEETNAEGNAATTDSQNASEVQAKETTSDSVKPDDSVSDSSTVEEDKKVIDLSDGEAKSKKTTQDPPKTKKKDIDYDIFIPRIKQLKGKNIESFSDEEIIELALNKLTCDSYKSLKGVENTPAIACWNHLYDVVGDGDVKLAKAICNLKKDFPGAMKYMLEQVKKIGSGGFDHNELFEFCEKYYFAKDKPKKDAKKECSKPVKVSDSPAKPAVPKKEKAAKPAKEKETKKVEKKDEPLQLSLLSLL